LRVAHAPRGAAAQPEGDGLDGAVALHGQQDADPRLQLRGSGQRPPRRDGRADRNHRLEHGAQIVTPDQSLKEMESHCTKALDAFKTRLSHLRTGRATVALLDPVKVEAYGQTMPLQQVASLSVPEPRVILVQPF